MAAHQAPLSLGFSRQEHWSGLPLPSPMHESESESEVAQWCPTLSDPMDCSLIGSSIHGIFQARVLESGAIAFSSVDHNKLWKILKEMVIPDHLICLLRNLYAGEEATVRTGHRTTDWFQIGKGVHQGCILSPCLFNFYAEYIMRNAGLEETSWNQDCREK